MTQTMMILNRDVNGFVTYGLDPITDSAYASRFVLAANVSQTVVVPSGPAAYYEAVFSFYSGVEVWVAYAASPSISLPTSTPTVTLTDLNPVARKVAAGITMQFISPNDDAGVCVTFRALPPQG